MSSVSPSKLDAAKNVEGYHTPVTTEHVDPQQHSKRFSHDRVWQPFNPSRAALSVWGQVAWN